MLCSSRPSTTLPQKILTPHKYPWRVIRYPRQIDILLLRPPRIICLSDNKVFTYLFLKYFNSIKYKSKLMQSSGLNNG